MSRRTVEFRRKLGRPDTAGGGKSGEYRQNEAAHARNGGGARGDMNKLLATLPTGDVRAKRVAVWKGTEVVQMPVPKGTLSRVGTRGAKPETIEMYERALTRGNLSQRKAA